MTFRVISRSIVAALITSASVPAMAAPVIPSTSAEQVFTAFTPTSFATLTAGPASSNVAIGAPSSYGRLGQDFVAWVQNLGTVGVNVQLGTDATIAVTASSGLYLPPGACAALNAMSGATPATYLAAIASSGPAQVNVVTGYGNPGSCPGNSAGASSPTPSAVTSTTPDVRAIGTIASATVGAAYTVPTNDQGTARFVVTGVTASGATLQAQYSADGGTTWEPVAALRPPLAYGTTITADGQYEVKASATTNLRLIVTVAGTGTINVASDLTSTQGLVGIVGSIPPGTNTIGKTGIDQTTPGTTNGVVVNSSALPTGAATAAGQAAGAPINGTAQSGGVAPLARIVSSAATTNATIAKASAGRVYRVFACNTTTTAVYLKFYNVITTPVPGTTPVFVSRALPAAGAAGGLACQSFDVADIGWSFSTGIAFALTTGNADTDATAPAAGAVTQLSVDGM